MFSMVDAQHAVKRPADYRDLAQDGRKLRWYRIAAGLSMRALSEKSGVAVGHISDLEHGNYSARATTLAALAAALGREIAALMPDEPKGTAA